jgi:hypothetical protein
VWPMALAVIIAATVAKLPSSLTDLPNTIGTPPGEYDAVVVELRRSVAPHTRFAAQPESDDRLNAVRITHVARYLGWATGLDAINMFNPELNRSLGAGYIVDRYRDSDPGEVARQLRRRGVGVLVVHQNDVRDRLINDPNYAVLTETPNAVVLRVQPDGRTAPPSLATFTGGGTATLRSAGAQGYSWSATVDQPGVAELAVGWSPRWSASIDGRSVPVTEAPDGLIGLAIEPGEHTIELHYHLRASAWLGLFISALTVVGLAGRQRVTGLFRRFHRATPQPAT